MLQIVGKRKTRFSIIAPNDSNNIGRWKFQVCAYVRLLDEDKIATANVMGSFLSGAGFRLPCSENCSESADPLPDNIIPIQSIPVKKFAEI